MERRGEFSTGAHDVRRMRYVSFRSSTSRFVFVFVVRFRSYQQCTQYAMTTLVCEEGWVGWFYATTAASSKIQEEKVRFQVFLFRGERGMMLASPSIVYLPVASTS